MNQILNERYGEKTEKFVQNLVSGNANVQKYIIDSLGYEYDGSEKFEKGERYLNNITPDFKISKGNKVLAIVECKGADINVTDYVRGIGQLLQYEHFFEVNYSPNKNDKYVEDFKTVYLYPSDVIKNNTFNVATFKYPKTTQLLEVNVSNYIVRSISEEEKRKVKDLWVGTEAVSQYYFRDTRLFEDYILLKYLDYSEKNNKNIEEKFNKKFIPRAKLELNILRKFETPNNRNWRNAWITLSNCGFIDSNNFPTEAGKYMSKKTYEEFCLEMFKGYIKPYAELIFEFLTITPSSSSSDLAEKINNKFNGKPVLFLTESEGRYLSSWMNIFRDDYGFLDFESRKKDRKINYNPFPSISDKEFLENIKKFTRANEYLERFKSLLHSGEV
jgi:hypothetical protein